MKIVKFTIIVFFFQSILFFGNAQNIGFLGKRLLVNFDCRISPTFCFPNYKGNDYFLSLDYTLSPNIEFVLFNSGSIGLAYSFVNTQFNHHGYLPLNITGYGIFYKQYLRSQKDYYQAPFGIYGLLRYDYMLFSTPAFPNMEDHSIMGFKIEFGYDYLLWKRVRLSWGVSLGFTTKGYKTSEYDYFSVPIPYQDQITNRIFVHYLFNNKFSIGILTF